jgi:hypothetical protein
MSAAPSSAAEVTSTIQNTTTAFSGRINNVTSIAVSVKTGAVADLDTLTYAAAVISQPTSSAVRPVWLDTTSFAAADFDYAAGGSDLDGSVTTPSTLGFIADQAIVGGITTATTAGTVTLTPTHIGTYVVRVWNETTVATPALSGAESYVDFTITVSAGVASITSTVIYLLCSFKIYLLHSKLFEYNSIIDIIVINK